MILYTIIANSFATRKAMRSNSLLSIGLALALSVASIAHPSLSNQAEALLTEEVGTDIMKAIDKANLLKVADLIKLHKNDMAPFEAKAIIARAIVTDSPFIARIAIRECYTRLDHRGIIDIAALGVTRGETYVLKEIYKYPDMLRYIDINQLLSFAAQNRKTEFADYILSNHKDEIRLDGIMQAFEISLEKKDTETARLFIAKHIGLADSLCEGNFHLRILPIAARYGNITAVKDLVEATRDVELPDLYATTTFQDTVKAGHYDAAIFLLRQYKRHITSEDKLKAFVASAFGGNGSILKVLIQEIGARNIPFHQQELSLQFAAQNGHLRVVRILLKTFGKQFNAATLAKAKQVAVKNNRVQVVKFLTEYRR
jgi:hypothetical protein